MLFHNPNNRFQSSSFLHCTEILSNIEISDFLVSVNLIKGNLTGVGQNPSASFQKPLRKFKKKDNNFFREHRFWVKKQAVR